METEDLEKSKDNEDAATQLRNALDQMADLKEQLEDTVAPINLLKEKFLSAIELDEDYKSEIGSLRQECEDIEINSRKLMALSSLSKPQICTFSFIDIAEATNNFDESLIIHQGSNTTIYKGLLDCTEVAVKVLPKSPEGSLIFQKQVDVLGMIRHPNFISLIGVCEEHNTLIYEYLSNGSLHDRLQERNTIPLSWKIRINIVIDLCSALIFLHSNFPSTFIHGNLNASNILLDRNFVCKVTNFGVSSSPIENINAKSDVYSFGQILLKLLTGHESLVLVMEDQENVEENYFKEHLQSCAGTWPFEHAKKLALLAVKCTAKKPESRPDLESEVWPVLEPMKSLCPCSPYYQCGSSQFSDIPSCYICPITKVIMQEPYVAADGYSYELKAIEDWFSSGQITSPSLHVELENFNLLCNHSLRASILDLPLEMRQMPNS